MGNIADDDMYAERDRLLHSMGLPVPRSGSSTKMYKRPAACIAEPLVAAEVPEPVDMASTLQGIDAAVPIAMDQHEEDDHYETLKD